ncbi:translation initiation factor eIF2B subunit epsilon-like [Haemaphysalis longicornis]
MVASTVKKLGKSDLKQEEILQAVVTADNFNDCFAPITKDHPWVLMPLVNRPLIEYTLQYLCTEGVQETFIFCGSHADKIRDYIRESKWSDGEMSVSVLSSEDYLSVGDMIRDLDAKALIRSDFVLVDGAVVGNVPLRPIIEEHRKTVSRDKGALMTLVFRQLPPWHRRRCRQDDFVLALNPETGKLLHHVKATSKCEFPLSVFQEQSRVSLRHDLQDCHVAICSPHVPPIFADNFDYQTGLDFVRGILEHEEIMGNSIYTHITDSCYAASACNLAMYDAISRDVLQRWIQPPDRCAGSDGSPACFYYRHNIYKPATGLQLSRSCVLEPGTFVGTGTKIGDKSVVSDSVIGNNCTIGRDVKLQGAYLWDNVVVEDGCHLQNCLLASGVVVKKNVTVRPHCVLSFGVVVGPDIELKEGTLLQSTPDTDGFEDEPGDVEECDASLVGKEGHGFRIEVEDAWGEAPPASEDEDSGPEEDDLSSDGTASPVDDTKLFYNEVVESLQRGVEENVKCDNLILEINSSRYAYNIAMRGVIAVVTRVVLEMPILLSAEEAAPSRELSAAEYGTRLRKCLGQFHALLRNYVRDPDSMADCLLGLEEFVASYERYTSATGFILKWLYDQEVLAEDTIIHWFHKQDPSASTAAGLARKAAAKFVQWLQEAEEESDEEEEEDDDGDDD